MILKQEEILIKAMRVHNIPKDGKLLQGSHSMAYQFKKNSNFSKPLLSSL